MKKIKGGAWWNPFGSKSNANIATQNVNEKIDIAKDAAKKLVDNISDVKIALDKISIAQTADEEKVTETPSMLSSLIPTTPVATTPSKSIVGFGKRKTVKGGKRRKMSKTIKR